MPSISTHMHFGKILIEKIDSDIDLPSYIIGLMSPETIFDKLDEYHTLDEDGNIDVREFYEKFNIKNLSLESKSFVLGYYSNLWLEEYYKFNASKLTIHNKEELPDEELICALEDTIKYYDKMAIGDFYKEIKNSICSYNSNFELSETPYINFNDVKSLLVDYFNDNTFTAMHKELIDEFEYTNFIDKGCNKFLKSL